MHAFQNVATPMRSLMYWSVASTQLLLTVIQLIIEKVYNQNAVMGMAYIRKARASTKGVIEVIPLNLFHDRAEKSSRHILQ